MAGSRMFSEKKRLQLQARLDASKSQTERNRMGQFSTPTQLAVDMLQYAQTLLEKKTRIRFIDPAIGTGSFYSALLSVFESKNIAHAVGYEIDSHYFAPTADFWSTEGLEVYHSDFTRIQAPNAEDRFDLLICNPPYVRHHHIDRGNKQRLQALVKTTIGQDFSGLAGLYCYFLGLSHDWMAKDGLAGWLIPSEFMDVNYGTAVKQYLLKKVTLLHIHRFDPDDVQFDDALVSSTVVWFRNAYPPSDHQVRFSFGGTLSSPEIERLVSSAELHKARKWTAFPQKHTHSALDGPRLGEIFTIKRGLATGNNKYFILTPEQIDELDLPWEVFKPILPSPRYLSSNEIGADDKGLPITTKRLFLLDCNLSEDEVDNQFPALARYFEMGKSDGVPDGYLCRHRKPWYAQENREPAPILCPYMSRGNKRDGKSFKFILNHSRATAANVYLLLYPKPALRLAIQKDPDLMRQIWLYLNRIDSNTLSAEGRVYGGGLNKLEPKELANVPCSQLAHLIPGVMSSGKQLELL